MVENGQSIATQGIIDSGVKSFLDSIKRSNRIWIRHTKKVDSPFSLFHPANNTFFRFQDCEKTLEWYIRVHLVNGILLNMLEARGIPCLSFLEKEHIRQTNESISYSCNYNNMRFEEQYPFEFIIHENNSKIGIRYLPIKSKRAEELLTQGIVDKILIISCRDDENKLIEEVPFFLSASSSHMKVFYSSLKVFFCKFFSEDEYDMYLDRICKAVKDANQIVGFHTIPQLTSRNVSDYKISIIDKLSEEDYKGMSFVLNPEQENKKKIKTKVPKISSEDIAVLLQYYMNQGLYKSLLGKNDYATCFFTSEYLYQTYCEQNNFDYTAIVTGYLKSVEQLVYTILLCIMKDEKKNHILIKRRYSTKQYPEEIIKATVSIPKGKREVKMLPLASSNKEYFDTTLNSMCDCLFSDADGWRVSKPGRDTILQYLRWFSQDCRNDHFHKHNITDWKEVIRIRDNTILCLFCLLGGNVYCNRTREGSLLLGIVDDSFDRLYKALCSISPARKFFILTFPNGETLKAVRLQHQENESYSEYGYALSSIKFIKVEDFHIGDYRAFIRSHRIEDEILITRQHMPERVDLYSYRGNKKLEW